MFLRHILGFECCALRVVSAVAAILLAQGATAQSKGYSSVPFGGTTFKVYTVKIDTYSVNRFELVQNTRDEAHGQVASRFSNSFLINGAIAEAGCNFIGLAVNKGKEINPINLSSGNGAFYMKPNGVFSVGAQKAEVVESNIYRSPADKTMAIQSGPMLIINGRMHPEFRENSTNRFYRSGVGVADVGGEQVVVFAVSNEPVNLFTAAAFFRDKFNCNNALSLQSSATVIELPFINATASNQQSKFCSYIVFRE